MTTTEQEWAERVRRWRESGEPARGFATAGGFSTSALYQWAKRLKEHGAILETTATEEKVRVLRVARVERVTAADASAELTVEIGLARLHVPSGADAAMLGVTIGALVDAARRGTR